VRPRRLPRPTAQHVRLGADRQGRLSALGFDAVSMSSRTKEFPELAIKPVRIMYAAEHRRLTQKVVPLDTPVPSWMRAPGEAAGMVGLEIAMDELATATGVDPIEVRIRNEAERHPDTGLPFNRRRLVDCLRAGADRFGWAERDPAPRSHRENGWLIGTGVASATYPAMRQPGSVARIRRTDHGYRVDIGAADIGTGSWTVLAQVAADALGIPYEQVDLRIGDTDLPNATVAGGSTGLASWGAAILRAAEEFRAEHGTDPAPGAEARAEAGANPAEEEVAMHSFGAHFARVRINEWTGEIRLDRMLRVFSAGRIVNPRTARSQFIGGMTMGVGMARHEKGELDPRTGHVVNHDLAEYHVPANADIPEIEVSWLDEEDPLAGPLGARGIGEIGIVGAAASVVNAAHHATGVRVRDLPAFGLVMRVDRPVTGATEIGRAFGAHRPGGFTAAAHRDRDGRLQRGHPVLLDARWTGEAAAAAHDDVGARDVLTARRDLLRVVDCSDLDDGADIDEPHDLARLRP